MSDLRKQFIKETGKKLKTEHKFDCEQCADEVLFDAWNDEYIFWVEDLANGAPKKAAKALQIDSVIGRFIEGQPVTWNNLRYWVVEDNGEDKVLVANSKTQQHHEYNDWWVNRVDLNAL